MSDTSQARTVADLPETFNFVFNLIESNLIGACDQKPAVIDCNGMITYNQLNECVNRMTNALRDAGVHP